MTSVTSSPARGAWSLAAALLEALGRSDLDAFAACLDADVRFRALLPPRTLDVTGAAATCEYFARWFGGTHPAELVDGCVGNVGARVYLRWRLRTTAPDAAPHVVEQHIFLDGTQRVTTLDLLCSGFQPEP